MCQFAVRSAIIMCALCLAGCSSDSASPPPEQGSTFEPTSGPMGGVVLGFSQDSQGNLFAGVISRGVFRSMDGGISWTESSSGLTDRRVMALEVTPGDTLYAGTNMGGVFRSVDHGQHWISIGMQGHSIRSLFVDGNQLLAGASDGAYRLQQDGSQWSQVGLGSMAVVSFCMNAARVLFAGTLNNGVYRSIDGGLNWTPSGIQNQYVLALAVTPGGMLLAGTLHYGIYRSIDGGANWTPSSMLNKTVSAFAFTSNSRVLAAAHDGVYGSTDDGASWNPGSLCNIGIVDLAELGGGVLVAATGVGVYRSADDGVSWVLETAGMKASIVWSFGTVSSTLFAGVQGGGLYATVDAGQTWAYRGLRGEELILGLLVRPEGHFLAGTEHGILRSLDAGEHWQSTSFTGHQARGFLVLPDGSILAGTQGGLLRSTDDGDTWTSTSNPNEYVLCLVRDSHGTLLAGTEHSGLFRSLNDGAEWTPANQGLPSGSTVTAIAAHLDGSSFAAVQDAGVFRSRDRGASWQLVKSVSGYPRGLVISPGGTVILAVQPYLGASSAYMSKNGDDWEEMPTGTEDQGVMSLGLHSDGRLYLGTWGHGVHRSTSSM